MIEVRPFDFVSFSEPDWLQSLASHPLRPNVLVLCRNVDIKTVVTRLMSLCAQAVDSPVQPHTLDLPTDRGGTLLLRDVADLTLRQQIELYQWMNRHSGGPQVISITSTPLLPFVENGRFLEGLFYRLNVVSVVATA